MRRRGLLAALAATLLVAAGCLGDAVPGDEPTPTERHTPPSVTDESPTEPPTATTDEPLTPLPDRTTTFLDGPEDRPERPQSSTAESVGEFAGSHEYRYAYHPSWTNEHSEVSLECELDDVANTSVGWRVTVSCTGSSNTGGETTGTATSTVVHADRFTRTFVYWVDEDSLLRERKRSG